MTGTGPLHLDLDQLADALAGEAEPDSTAHLASCSSCTSRLRELEAAEAGVTAALRTLPPPALPEGLAERLTAALAAEPGLRSSTAGAGVTALPERRPSRRLLPAAAATVLALSAGALGYSVVTGSQSSEDSGSADSEAAAAAPAVPTSASGADYADAAAVSGVLPGVLAGQADALRSMDSAAGAAATAPSAPSEEARTTTMQAPAPAAATVGDPLGRLRTPEGLADCLSAVLPPEEPGLQPRALDYATYQGQPALAVLLPDPDPAKVSVYVVGPECAAADARLLGFFRLDAP